MDNSTSGNAVVQIIFALTVFVSSALLFWVQPMFSKMVLPLLGGSPAVWNTCLFFYQATLLLGYVYVHLSSKWLRVRNQIFLHLILMWAVFLTTSPGFEYLIPRQGNPIFWLSGVFWGSIGLPFFILSATTPLLQWWFRHTDHPDAHNPYVLYAISNVGSLSALLGYPLLIEPYLHLHIQTLSWFRGYGVLACLLSGCIILMRDSSTCEVFRNLAGFEDVSEENLRGSGKPRRLVEAEDINWRQRLRWLVAAFVPASLLLGVTNHITTDIAAVPLFWVIPLSLYLLTFVLVFARKSLLRHAWMLHMQTYLTFPLLLLCLGELRTTLRIDLPLHLFAFFVFTMVCHGELAQSKPASIRLTEFYVWMAAGGFLGGMFTALIAPLIFDTIIEYPLMIGLACLLRPVQHSGMPQGRGRWFLLSLFAALLLLPAGLLTGNQERAFFWGMLSIMLVMSIGGAFCFYVLNTPKRLMIGIGSFMFAVIFLLNTRQDVLVRKRNFFGALKVTASATDPFYRFYHGTTLHGLQYISSEQHAEALAYFHYDGPVGQLFRHLESKPARSMAVFGLGIGTLAAYARLGDEITFYEIDPQVEQVARDPRWFHYLKDCAGQVRVILGDARISLANAPDHSYAMIIQDAFSSDNIPVHLLTREAFRLYKSKLTANGMLVFNITNRYLDLEPVLADLIRDSGMFGLIQRDQEVSKAKQKTGRFPSVWVIAIQQKQDFGTLPTDSRWKPLQHQTGARLWTDDYSNILSVIKFSESP